MRGRGILLVEGLITRRTFLNEACLSPLVVSTQVRALSTAQEKANTRAMLDRMLRFDLLFECCMLQCVHSNMGENNLSAYLHFEMEWGGRQNGIAALNRWELI